MSEEQLSPEEDSSLDAPVFSGAGDAGNAASAADEYVRRKEAGESLEPAPPEPKPPAPLRIALDGNEPMSVKEAGAALDKIHERLARDPEYAARARVMTDLKANGIDPTVARGSDDMGWEEYERRRAAELYGLDPDRVTEPERPAVEQPTEQQQPSPEQRAAEATRQQGLHQLPQFEAAKNQVRQAFQQEFGITDPRQLANLAPEQVGRLQQYVGAMQDLELKESAVRIVTEHAENAQFTSWAEAEDAKAMKAIPEAKDPAKYEALQKAALEALKDAGMSMEDIQREYTRPGGRLRDSTAQVLLAQAARARLMQTTKTNLRANLKHVPPMQRPGVYSGAAQSESSQTEAELVKAFEKAGASGNVRQQIQIGARLSEVRAGRQARNSNGTWR